MTPPSRPCPGPCHRPTGPGSPRPAAGGGVLPQRAASWFPSGAAAPPSLPAPPRGCNPRRPAPPRPAPPRLRRSRAQPHAARSPDSQSAGAMGRGACVPSAASGARDQARRLGAVLGALCLLPALVLLARLGAPAARPAASAAQVRAARGPAGSAPGPRVRERLSAGGGDGVWPPAPPPPTWPAFRRRIFLSGCRSNARSLGVEKQKTLKDKNRESQRSPDLRPAPHFLLVTFPRVSDLGTVPAASLRGLASLEG